VRKALCIATVVGRMAAEISPFAQVQSNVNFEIKLCLTGPPPLSALPLLAINVNLFEISPVQLGYTRQQPVNLIKKQFVISVIVTNQAK